MHRFQILNTKLYKPDIKDHYVFRKEIIYSLEKNRSNPLTLVIAATGYGKSVTVSEWLDYTKAKYCWISVDEELNDFRTFLLYLVTSVKTAVNDSLPELSEILGAQELPSDSVIINTLINELDEIRDDLILVIDDYHFVKNTQIHSLIEDLLKYPPSKFHLVIISRRDPPIDLSTLKSYDKINQIRMNELSFNRSEILSLAGHIIGNNVSDHTADLLFQRTEGWIVGLRLALLALGENKEVEKTLEEIKGDRHYLTEYLLREVFLKNEEDVRELLLTASILERFNKEILQELISDLDMGNTSKIDSLVENLFDRFRKSTLFIIPLNNDGTWFRYHHFFQEFLLKRLDSEYSSNQINELHRKACNYFEKNEHDDEAMQHALIAGDINCAVRIVEKNKYSFIETDQFGRLSNLLGKLPTGTVEKHLGLLLTRAFLYDTLKDFNSMRNDLIIAEKLIAKSGGDLKINKQLLGEFHTVSSNWNFEEGNIEAAYKNSKKAVELLNDGSAYLHDYAIAYQMFSLNDLGKSDDAIFILKDNLRKLSPSESVSKLRNLIIQSIVYASQGNLPEIMKATLEYHSISVEKKLWVSLAYSTYYLSETSYQWNDLDKAVDYAKALGNHYYSGRPSWVVYTLYTKAFALNASGKFEELNDTITEIKEVTENINKEIFNNSTRAFEVELAIRQNDISKALELAKITNFESFHPVQYFYFPQLTFAKLLMSTDEPNKIAEAEKRIKELIVQSRTTYKYNILMQALLLQSLLLRKKDNFEFAFKALKESVKLAEPGGFIRIFIDLGEPMKNLLEEVRRTESDNSYISKILKAFEKENVKVEKVQDLQEKVSPVLILNDLEKLSGREITLLKLISEGKRNQEIADQLYVSIHSIKKYLYNIYQKLGVRNRVAAILKADELGLIS